MRATTTKYDIRNKINGTKNNDNVSKAIERVQATTVL